MTRLTSRRPGATAALVLVAALGPVCGRPGEAEPFRTRNLSPLISVFGIPAWSLAPLDVARIGFTAELANHYRFSRRGDETLILDGETWRGALLLENGFGEKWSASLELPYYRQSGGVLDDVIDLWHAAFNLPDGGRNRRAEDQIAYVLDSGAGPFYALGARGGAMGDVSLSLGRTFDASDGGARRQLRATVKLPTGDESWFAGSGAADLALTWLASRRADAWGRPAGYYWGIGGLLLGTADRIEFDARRRGLMGIVGGGIRPWPRWGIKAQVELHSAFYESHLPEIGDPGVQLTVGGWRDLGGRGVVELAVNEDLAVSSSPDLVVHMHFRWDL